MSDTRHTEGLLKLHEVGGLLCPATLDDLSLLTVATDRDEFGDKTVFGAVYKPEDAKRLVACWNACREMEQKVLEDPEYSVKAELDSLDKIIETSAQLLQQRDTAWQELREIREAIKADENESTADEVRSLVAKYDSALRTLEDHGPEVHNVTNQQYVELRKERDESIKVESTWKVAMKSAIGCDGPKSVFDAIHALKRRQVEFYERLEKLESIATAVEADIDSGRPLEYNVDELRAELIRARKSLGMEAST